MKKKLAIAFLCIVFAASAAAGCGKTNQPSVDPEVNSSTVSENSSLPVDDDVNDVDDVNDPDDPNEDTDPDDPQIDVSEQVEDQVDTNSKEFADLADTMTVIYEVFSGTAGSSLRAEEASADLAKYVSDYGTVLTEDQVEDLAEAWFDLMEAEQPSLRKEFEESFEEVCFYIQEFEEELAKSEGYITVVKGITDAISD